MDINLVNAEVLTVGPDETLIIKVDDSVDLDDQADFLIHEAFQAAGLSKNRYLIVQGDWEFAKVKS